MSFLKKSGGSLLGNIGGVSPPKPPVAPVQTPALAKVESNANTTAVVVVPKSGFLSAVAKVAESKAATAVDLDYLFNEEPKDFRTILDNFDRLLARDTGIDDFNIDTCRSYVQRIYTDLDTQPELIDLMIPKDIGNVIHFIRSVRERALDAGIVKKEKAEKKGTVAKVNRFGAKGLTLDLNSIPASLDELSKSDWDM